MSLSIVIPAYNEETRIGPTIGKVKTYLSERGMDGEIIVVNDGSSDGTAEVLEGVAGLKVVILERNRGKGAAVREGLKASAGSMILITDADLSVPIEEADKLIKRLEEGFDIVIGSRGVSDSDVRKYQPPLRLALGVAFGFVVRALFQMPFADTQCGFKLMTAEAAKSIGPFMKINGFTFDVEMLALAIRMGMQVSEVGVEWRDAAGSKLKLAKDFRGIIKELIQIKKNLRSLPTL